MVFNYRAFRRFAFIIIFTSSINALTPRDFVIEYNGDVPSKVFYKTGKGKQLIEHVSLCNLVDERQKKSFDSFDTSHARWKTYMHSQIGVASLAAYAGARYYIDDNGIQELKKNSALKKLHEKLISISYPRLIGSVSLAAAVCAPFCFFRTLFSIWNLEDTYPVTNADDKVLIIQRKTYSHSEQYGNYVVHYYNHSDPLGYILADEKEEQFKQARRSKKALLATILNQTGLAVAGFWAGNWLLSSWLKK